MASNQGILKINGEDYYPCPYVVGDLYITTNSENPSNKYGGTTWELFAPGRTLVCVDTEDTDFDTVEKTGGHKDMQQHYHLQYFTSQYGYRYPLVGLNGVGGNVEGAYTTSSVQSTTRPQIHSGTTGTGDSRNLQPFITCYMWLRTA